MKKLFSIALIFFSCSYSQKNSEQKFLVIETEKKFAEMAHDKGISQAFYAFADDSAVIKRGPKIIKGKEAIKNFYDHQNQKGELTWSPTFADVSGDLAYTYGDFTYAEKDSTGKVNEIKGIFHTVWKKQKDGSWKFVWD